MINELLIMILYFLMLFCIYRTNKLYNALKTHKEAIYVINDDLNKLAVFVDYKEEG